MTKRTGWGVLGLFLVAAMLLSACSKVARGEAEAGAGEVTRGLAPVEEVVVIIMERLPSDVGAIVSGNLPDGCTELGEAQVTREGNTFRVVLPTTRDPEAMCTMALVPFELAIPLETLGLQAGVYTVEVNGVTTTFELAVDNILLEA